ncbi:MAG: hypothetical protein R3C53_08835 [Pirellulaceae bacterium]
MDRSPAIDRQLHTLTLRVAGWSRAYILLVLHLSACVSHPHNQNADSTSGSLDQAQSTSLAKDQVRATSTEGMWAGPSNDSPPLIEKATPTTLSQPHPEQLRLVSWDDQNVPTVTSNDLPYPLPTSPPQIEIPLPANIVDAGAVQSNGQLITLSVRDAPLHSVLSLIAEQQGLSIATSSDLTLPISVTLQPMVLEEALDALTVISGCTWTRVGNVIFVTAVNKDAAENFVAQGRVMRVFNLNYLAALDAEKVVTGLLSPVGKVFIRQMEVKEKRKSTEQLVIEDLPEYAARIESYVAQADQPPQQVIVEVRMLQVKLHDDTRHGINFDALARIAGGNVTFATQALATGTGQAAMLTVDGNDFNTLLDCLSTTNDTKTLAAPKLRMINGQESKIQIGRRLGYFVTTTTQTSTLQDVQFLEVGVVLTVTPQISSDGQIVLKVHPKVSSGDINPSTTLPEEETTEVDTSIMVPNGHGVIIGGLIQEIDNDRQSKVPFLGDVWVIGRLFQRRSVERERSEVIVALLPRIVPLEACMSPEEDFELQRAGSPLLTPTLQSAPRPEPELRDATNNPIWPPRRRR